MWDREIQPEKERKRDREKARAGERRERERDEEGVRGSDSERYGVRDKGGRGRERMSARYRNTQKEIARERGQERENTTE